MHCTESELVFLGSTILHLGPKEDLRLDLILDTQLVLKSVNL